MFVALCEAGEVPLPFDALGSDNARVLYVLASVPSILLLLVCCVCRRCQLALQRCLCGMESETEIVLI